MGESSSFMGDTSVTIVDWRESVKRACITPLYSIKVKHGIARTWTSCEYLSFLCGLPQEGGGDMSRFVGYDKVYRTRGSNFTAISPEPTV